MPDPDPDAADVRTVPFHVRAALSGLGAGFSPVLPGTVASVATAAVAFLVERASGAGLATCGVLFALSCAATLAWGREAERHRKDPSWVVTDEVAGQAMASAAALLGGGVLAHVAALVLFRVLDIAKPGPIDSLQRTEGGMGILLDDLAAGFVAALLVGALGVAGVL